MTSSFFISRSHIVSRPDAYKRDVHYHIIPALGRRKLKDLSTTDIRRFYRQKRDEELSNRSLEYIHTTLRKALEDAKNEGIRTRNPTDGARPHKTPQGAAKASEALLDPNQVAGLLSAASADRWEALSTSLPYIRGLGAARFWACVGRMLISKKVRYR